MDGSFSVMGGKGRSKLKGVVLAVIYGDGYRIWVVDDSVI